MVSDSGGMLALSFVFLLIGCVGRVEKYRPDTFEDVSGHQDILATINKFVECNVWLSIVLWNAPGAKF